MRVPIFLSLLAAAPPALAEDLTAPEAAVLPRIISSLCANLDDGRTGCETAVLVASADEDHMADLAVLSDRRDGPVETLAVARAIAWDGPMWGQAPWLEAIGNGPTQSLRLMSENIGVGRTAWTRTLTLAFRDGAYVVAGFTYTTRDRLNTAYGTCDVNLLTGGWETEAGIGALDEPPEISRGTGSRDVRPIPEWSLTGSGAELPSICESLLNRVAELSERELPE